MAATIDAKGLFVDDDEEILSTLLAGAEDVDDLPSRLESLAKRFVEDYEGQHPHWLSLVNSAKELGFTLSDPQPIASLQSNVSTTFPAAFDTEDGQLHLQATCAALGLSKFSAVQLTLSALRSVSIDNAAFQSLLGTKVLLQKVIDHYFHQRVSRMQVIAECLRIEQDESLPLAETVAETLDSVDAKSLESGKKRGLFRMLLLSACQGDVPFRLEALLPAKSLREVAPSTLQESMVLANEDDESVWRRFVQSAIELKRQFVQRERLEALEALMALLYSRMDGGTHRVDFALILLALQSAKAFFTGFPAGFERLPRLAGLICVECMSLMCVVTNPTDDEVWVQQHPMFSGLLVVSDAERELRAIESLLVKFATQLVERRNQLWGSMRMNSVGRDAPVLEGPEGLAVLSFGLLLMVAHQCLLSSPFGSDINAYWQTFKETGTELCKFANIECDTFDYIYKVMDSLVDPINGAALCEQGFAYPYEMHYFGDQTNEPSNVPPAELGAASLTYASIGRELLSTVVQAFDDTILSVDHASAPENLSMLSNLASVVFCTSPSLCAPFWEDWDVYTSPRALSGDLPLCRVLDSAYTLASTCQLSRPPKPGDDILRRMVPLLEFVASVVYDARVTELALKSIIPDGLIHSALVLCSSSNSSISLTVSRKILKSLSVIATKGTSSSCRALLRRLLEKGDDRHSVGPRILLAISMGKADVVLTARVYTILAELLQDAPDAWVLEVASGLSVFRRTDDRYEFLACGDAASIDSVASLVQSMVIRLDDIAFHSSFGEDATIAYFSVVEQGLQSCGSTLAKIMSAASVDSRGRTTVRGWTARTMLCCLSSALLGVRPIIQMHNSSRVQDAAIAVRDSVVTILSAHRGLSDAVLYFATNPISLGLLGTLTEQLSDSSFLNALSSDENASSADDYGRIGQVMKKSAQGNEEVTQSLKKSLRDIVSDTDSFLYDVDPRKLHTFGVGVIEDGSDGLGTALAAMRLLNAWAQSVDDMAVTVTNESTDVSFGPYRFLCRSPILPEPLRSRQRLSSVWVASCVTNFDLILRYISYNDVPCMRAQLAMESLDCLYLCFVQGKKAANELSDDSLLRCFYDSSAFRELVSRSVDNISAAMTGTATIEDGMHMSVDTRILRLASSCVESSAALGTKVLGDSVGESIGTLCNVVIGTIELLQRTEEIQSLDESLTRMLRLANASLAILVPFWRHARNFGSQNDDPYAQPARQKMQTVIEQQSRLTTELVALVFLPSDRMNPTMLSDDESHRVLERLVASATSLAVDLLTIELSWLSEDDASLKADPPIFQALASAMSQDCLRFVPATSACLRVNGLLQYDGAYKSVLKEVGANTLSRLPIRYLALSATRLERDTFSQCNGLDVYGVNDLLTSIRKGPLASAEWSALLRSIAVLRGLIDSELERVKSWTAFAEVLSLLVEKAETSPSASSHFLASYGGGTFAVELVKELSHCLNSALVSVEQTSTATGLVAEGGFISNAMATLLLHFTTQGSTVFTRMSTEEWLTTATSLGSCCRKITSITETERTTDTVSLQHLFSAAATLVLSEPREESTSHELRSKVDDVLSELAATACGTLRRVEKSVPSPSAHSSSVQKYRDCFSSSVFLLSALVSKVQTDYQDTRGRHTYGSKLNQVFKDSGVISSLVWQAGSFDSGGQDPAHVAVLAVLRLFTTVAATGELSLLSLLVESEATRVLSRSGALLAEREGAATLGKPAVYRGYLVADRSGRPVPANTGSVMSGIDDPTYVVWRCSLRFLSSALRSLSCHLSAQQEISQRLLTLAIDFLIAHQNYVISCLGQCRAEGIVPVFTLNLLKEVTCVFSLAAELCGRRFVDSFRRRCPDLFDALLHHSKYLMISLSSYLGAAAASRELFKAMEDYESSGATAHDHLLTSSGVPNAKHEAIRFSHFVSRSFVAITEAETGRQEQYTGRWDGEVLSNSSDPKSLSSLERNCRRAVTSDFSFELEEAAADCLFFALNAIWRCHPSCSAFEMYAEDEARHLDAMPLVRPGMVIAFRAKGHDIRGWVSLAGEESRASHAFPLKFGEVLSSDTVHRVWRVRLVGDGGEEVLVPAEDIAGIEDTTKRTCMFSYTPAPETSSELEALLGSSSVGHLILASRWCRQSWNELKTNDSLIRRLSEQAAVLLGAELSIHRENGSQMKTPKGDEVKAIASQVFDLFGREIGSSSNHAGRMKEIVTPLVWNSLQKQLQPELEAARKEIESRDAAMHSSFDGDDWFGGRRRRSSFSMSPFRGLGM